MSDENSTRARGDDILLKTEQGKAVNKRKHSEHELLDATHVHMQGLNIKSTQ